MIVDAEIANEALTTTDEVLGMYIEVLDRAVPWKAFEQTLAELDKYKSVYSEQSVSLIDDIKLLMKNAIDAYYKASELIFRWCDTATPLLAAYVELFKDHTVEKAHTQKDLLVEILKKGITEMEAAQDEISQSSVSFNSATGSLTELNSRFHVEFDEINSNFESKINWTQFGSILFSLFGININGNVFDIKLSLLKAKFEEIQSFYNHLKLQVEQAFHDVDETKIKLSNDILKIGDLKTKTEETKTFVDLDDIPDLRDELIESGQSLLNKCNEYRRKHVEKHNH